MDLSHFFIILNHWEVITDIFDEPIVTNGAGWLLYLLVCFYGEPGALLLEDALLIEVPFGLERVLEELYDLKAVTLVRVLAVINGVSEVKMLPSECCIEKFCDHYP